MLKSNVDNDKFWRDGYLILKKMFSPVEFASMREEVFASLKSRARGGNCVVDALAGRHLQHSVHDERFIQVTEKKIGHMSARLRAAMAAGQTVGEHNHHHQLPNAKASPASP